MEEDGYCGLLGRIAVKEMDEFERGLRKMSPQAVMAQAYEYITKQDILSCILDRSLSEAEAKALCARRRPLDFCYGEWLHSDASQMEMLRGTIRTAAEKDIRETRRQESCR